MFEQIIDLKLNISVQKMVYIMVEEVIDKSLNTSIKQLFISWLKMKFQED
jgi:hypothetical protein